jgi:hypothetical protein
MLYCDPLRDAVSEAVRQKVTQENEAILAGQKWFGQGHLVKPDGTEAVPNGRPQMALDHN